MYIPITFKKLLEIGKQKEEFSNFHSEPAKFSQKIHKEKVFMKIFTINLTTLHTNSYQNIRYSYHYGKKIPTHIVFNIISTQIYPCSKYHTLMALIPPSRPVPLPKGIRGTLCSLHSRATPDTCSTLSAKATTWGGAHLV